MILLFSTTVDVEIEPEQIARLFCDMDSEQQARFFNTIAKTVSKEWDQSFSMQMQYLTDDETLTNDGREIMKTIGTYAYKE